jgi:hypothetical protein
LNGAYGSSRLSASLTLLAGTHHLGITSIYVQGIDSAEVIDTVHARHSPVVPVNSALP